MHYDVSPRTIERIWSRRKDVYEGKFELDFNTVVEGLAELWKQD